MLKSFLIIISFSILLIASEQIVLVVSPDMNSSTASLECIEDGKTIYKPIDVNIGKNGLGWGIGFSNIIHNQLEVKKYEGDKKAPIGIFKLSSIFGYKKKSHFKMPYIYASENLICVDDSDSKEYNKIISLVKTKPKSFEYMRRHDSQYRVGIVVQHNTQQRKGRGSCIFLHVEKGANKPTVGCTSMPYPDIVKIVNWLDEAKHPILIQIPKKYIKEVLKLYPQLKNAQLIQREN